MPFYLASTSPARLTILRAAGIEPVVLPSHVDEPAVISGRERELGRALGAHEVVAVLARAKAQAVAARAADEGIDGLLLGCDSVFALDGTIYGKPHTAQAARSRWHLQRGRTGTLYTGHCLLDLRGGTPAGMREAVAGAGVTFADDIGDAEIDAYIASGEPLEVAGAFTIDGLGGPLVTRVEGDPSTVVGLSLSTVRRLAGEFGVRWSDLWTRNVVEQA